MPRLGSKRQTPTAAQRAAAEIAAWHNSPAGVGLMQHSASSITLAERCPRAWWHRYRDGLKQPELSWAEVKRLRARGEQLPSGAFGKALGKELHRLAEFYLYLPPRKAAKRIDWNDLPGQCLAELVPHIPPAGSVPRNRVERAISVVVNGVRFRGLIDVVGEALGRCVEVWDHKTTRDIRAYAMLPHAVAVRTHQPKRSLKDDLQACLYVLARAKESRPAAAGGLCRWNYTETQRSRRALPVVQYIPIAHARTVAERAAVTARTVEGFRTIEDATPNTLACDQYGGCWYRHEGHCRVKRKWGAVFIQNEREEKERIAMGKPLTFKALGTATAKANAVEEAKAPKPAKKAPPPPPVDEDDAEDEDLEEAPESVEPPPAPAPKAKRKAKVALPPVEVEEDAEDEPESVPEPVATLTPREAFNAATAAPDHILQFFGANGRKGEAKIISTAFAELAEHLSANLPRNPERAQCLRKLLEANDCAVRAAASEG
jgi:hypothetical protein